MDGEEKTITVDKPYLRKSIVDPNSEIVKGYNVGIMPVYKDQISDVGVLESDGKLLTKEINLSLAEAIRNGGPWGQAFPEPLFDNRFRVVDKRIVGGRHLKLKLQPEGSLQPFDAIAFNRDELPRRETGSTDGLYRVAYRLDVNEFRGRQSVQLLVDVVEPYLPIETVE